MSSGQIVLFDLPSRPPRSCWSLNPWKTRFLLNYKGLDYRTEWLEYPEIKPRLEGHVTPADGAMRYTIPTVLLPDGRYVMDSRKIADVIEAEHPSPSVHLDSPYLAKVEGIIARSFAHVAPILLPAVPRTILADASIPYWMETRSKMVGKPLDQFERENPAEKAWDALEPALRDATALLEENAQGPFFMGGEVSYADFVWGGFLLFFQRMGPETWEELLRRSGNAKAHLDLLEALAPWSKRNDH
ncbi:hypothetical protein VTK56DRAFT_5753 [Thermocarpiscus australiensis]